MDSRFVVFKMYEVPKTFANENCPLIARDL